MQNRSGFGARSGSSGIEGILVSALIRENREIFFFYFFDLMRTRRQTTIACYLYKGIGGIGSVIGDF